MTDVQILTLGDVPYSVTVAVDRLAALLEPYSGWAIRVDIDPGVVLVATPAPERPSAAPLSPEQDPYGRTADRDDSSPSDGRTA